jgi:hypothetical protein
MDTALGHICGFFGPPLPRCRIVDSNPNVAAMFACQASLPKGCCRFTQVRKNEDPVPYPSFPAQWKQRVAPPTADPVARQLISSYNAHTV